MVEFSPLTFTGGPVASSSLSGSTVSLGGSIGLADTTYPTR